MNYQSKFDIPRIKRLSYGIFDHRIIVTCWGIIKDNGIDKIVVYFEQIRNNAMCTASCVIPDYHWIDKADFSEEDIYAFENYIKEKEESLFRYCKEQPVKLLSREEYNEWRTLLYPNGKIFAGNVIDQIPGSILITEAEKESIYEKISSFLPSKPSFKPPILLGLLWVAALIVWVLALIYENIPRDIGINKDVVIAGGYCLLMLLLLIFVIYYCSKIQPYFTWKQDIKDLKKSNVHKVLVEPLATGIGNNAYWMSICNEKGLPLDGYFLIQKTVYEHPELYNIWAYYHKAPKHNKYYGKYKIYLVGENK